MVKNHATDDSRYRIRGASGFILRENPYRIERAEREVRKIANAVQMILSATKVTAQKRTNKHGDGRCCGVCGHADHDRRKCPARRR